MRTRSKKEQNSKGLTGGASFVTGQLVFERMAYVMGYDDNNKIKGAV